MPIVVPSKIDLPRGLVLNMLGTPTKKYDTAFDSYLLLKNGSENHTLTLVLKIFLDRVATPFGLPAFPHADANGTLFWIRPWPAAQWVGFQRTFKQQCLRWNDRFWLIPPAGFSALDVKVGTRTVRPNIYCHLFIELIAAAGGAHRSIEVVNLDKNLAAAQLGTQPGNLNSGAFRSHEGLYDSLDITPRTNTSQDNRGRNHRHVNYLTIVHEIGHALGLPHVGVSHHDPLCSAAIFWNNQPLLNGLGVPALFKGASNSGACYGTFALPSHSDNVMGRGTKFDETNAQPWRDRIALHTATKAGDWKVSLCKVPPKVIS